MEKERFLVEITDPMHAYAQADAHGGFAIVEDPNDASQFVTADDSAGLALLEQVRSAHSGAFMSRHLWV